MSDNRETLDWEHYGVAARQLAQIVADDEYQPDIILAIARGGLFARRALGRQSDVGAGAEAPAGFAALRGGPPSARIFRTSSSPTVCMSVPTPAAWGFVT